MIMKNDYQMRLFNGDTGIILSEKEKRGEPVALFRDPTGTFRKFLPPMLPEHETAFAMTVHKSQGSEFDKIMIILPDRDSPVLTRELLYTAISRAKKGVSIWGNETLIRNAVARPIVRTSGLWEALWGSHSDQSKEDQTDRLRK
jgi:exodeoxyribonuclease V alpha subunit